MFERVLITSGPTFEPIDPVRFIGNRSSGITGLHLAHEFASKYADEVVFVSGPVCRYPEGVKVIRVETALEMNEVVFRYFNQSRVIVMAAAVGDFRPRFRMNRKIKKGSEIPMIELEPNPDILREAGSKKKSGQILVGFAAETDSPRENGQQKFNEKNLDLLVLNEVSMDNPAFGAVRNRVSFLRAAGYRDLPRMHKREIAAEICKEVADIHERRTVKE